MKNSNLHSSTAATNGFHSVERNIKSAFWACFVILFIFGRNFCFAQDAIGPTEGEEIQTRGPVHEAFAAVVSYDPEPGIVVSKAPPESIEEVPPEERPDGDNVAWIPGYWAWDDERSDFLWISGTWRALPPGREWFAGYWNQTPQGYQWISGYWADAAVTDTTFLPPPPKTVETGPNIEAPSDDYEWTPGCWIWYEGRYAWRPGYWTQGRADWDWIPAHYVWTPRGYIFIEGYWDYSVERRGVLFAPVYLESRVYSRRAYHYSPRIVINLSIFNDHLFLRPRYCHYYFGDYYGPTYQTSGIYASFSFQSGRRGYDPFYSHQRWIHREDREWERRVAASYQYRREHEAARPPRTWSAQVQITERSTDSRRERVVVATSYEQVTRNREGPSRFRTVDREERNRWTERSREVQKSREQRRTIEVQADNRAAQATQVSEPAKVQRAKSPIVAQALSQTAGSPPPPPVQSPPSASKVGPKSNGPDRQSNAERNQRRSRQTEQEKKTVPRTNEIPRATENPSAAKNPPPAQQPAQSRAPESADKQPPTVREREAQPRPETERRHQPAPKNESEPERRTRERDKPKQQESDQREKASAVRAQEETMRKAKEQELKSQEAAAQRKAEAAQKAEEARQRAQARDQQEKQQQQEATANQQRAAEESRRNAREAAAQEQAQPQRNAQARENAARDNPQPPDARQAQPQARKQPKPQPNERKKEREGKPAANDDATEPPAAPR